MATTFPLCSVAARLLTGGLIFTISMLSGCSSDDPKRVNEEEVITTIEITLVDQGGGPPVQLRFFDPDGELGATPPEITVSRVLDASSIYAATIRLANETEDPPVDITEEVSEEANDHLLCFAATGDIAVEYNDLDANGMPLGLITTWETGAAGPAAMTITLRHQADSKTGECPGGGETDVEVTFELMIE